MLNLRAKIADEVSVTFVKADRGVQTQERINGHRAFHCGKGTPARPGDICVAKIVGENPRQTVYFVQVMKVLKPGDGETSVLEKVLAPINWREGLYRFDPEGTIKGLAIATDHFGNDELGLLELLTEILEYYTLEDCIGQRQLDYELVCSSAEKIITKRLSNDPNAAASAYLRLGELCANYRYQVQLTDLARRLFCKATEWSDMGAPDLLERSLKAVESLDGQGRYGRCDMRVKQRLIAIEEQQGVAVSRRIELAKLKLKQKDAVGARAILEPLCVSHPAAIAKVMGESYLLEADYAQAKGWLEQAQGREYLTPLLAEALFGLGDFEPAARLYRKALQDCESQLESALEDR